MADTSTGWVKLFRSFTQWEWYTDTNVKAVFLHLFLVANPKDNAWHGKAIKRGQLVTSYRHLSAAVGLDVHTIHRAIKKLVSTGEITVESHAKFSATVKQRSSNSQATSEQSTKEYKNNKNKKEDTPAAFPADAEEPTGWRAREGHDF